MPRSKPISKRKKALLRTSAGQLLLVRKPSAKSPTQPNKKAGSSQRNSKNPNSPVTEINNGRALSEIRADEKSRDQMRLVQINALHQHQLQLEMQKSAHQRVEHFDLAEDLIHIYQVFKLSISTIFLAISILQRAFFLTQGGEGQIQF